MLITIVTKVVAGLTVSNHTANTRENVTMASIRIAVRTGYIIGKIAVTGTTYVSRKMPRPSKLSDGYQRPENNILTGLPLFP